MDDLRGDASLSESSLHTISLSLALLATVVARSRSHMERRAGPNFTDDWPHAFHAARWSWAPSWRGRRLL